MIEHPIYNLAAFWRVIVDPIYDVGVNWRVIAAPNYDLGENWRVIAPKSIVHGAKNLNFVWNLMETGIQAL